MEQLSPELFQRFLQNRCSDQEARQVTAYFEKYPGQLERYLPVAEWEEIGHDVHLDPEISKKLLRRVTGQALGKKAGNAAIRQWLVRTAAALLVAVTIALLVFLVRQAPRPVTSVVAGKKGVMQAQRIVYVNNGRVPVDVRLEDGSVARLGPASQIGLMKRFPVGRRDIVLHGEAEFKVAHDKKRPFTVFAGQTATTALGTVFRVTDVEGRTGTSVQLISGRIRVLVNRPASAQQAFYPGPGERVDVDRLTGIAKVVKPAPAVLHAPVSPVPEQTWAFSDTAVSFVNTPVWQIMDILQQRFHVEVSYQKGLLDNMFFTGSFKHHDDLAEEIIGTIALVNQLQMERSDRQYRLSKKSHK